MYRDILIGANSDEGTAFSPSPVNSTEALFNYMTRYPRGAVPPELATQLLELYPDDTSVNVVASLGDVRPGAPYGPQFRRAASYFGDQVFIANRRLTCETWYISQFFVVVWKLIKYRAAAGLSAYCYRFNAIPAGLPVS